jgi:hypothetical protein
MTGLRNAGHDPLVIAEYRKKMEGVDQLFLSVDEDDNSDEYHHFYFVGKHVDQEVIFDTVMCTLRLEHESELLELAEERAIQEFPQYAKLQSGVSEEEKDEELEEQVGLFLADVIVDLQEEGTIKVQEHIDVNEEADFGVGLDVGLHVEKISPEVIERFIKQFNDDTLKLDDTLYSFVMEEGEGD